jgi:hypothetical protein
LASDPLFVAVVEEFLLEDVVFNLAILLILDFNDGKVVIWDIDGHKLLIPVALGEAGLLLVRVGKLVSWVLDDCDEGSHHLVGGEHDLKVKLVLLTSSDACVEMLDEEAIVLLDILLKHKGVKIEDFIFDACKSPKVILGGMSVTGASNTIVMLKCAKPLNDLLLPLDDVAGDLGVRNDSLLGYEVE